MQGSLDYFQFSRSEVAPFLPTKYSKVLEVGCASGAFRGFLIPECEYWGIEAEKNSAKVASGRMNKLLIGTYQDFAGQLPNDYFDLIICNDVIEHMPDHDFFFKSIKKKMKKNGYLVGSIPNVRYLKNLLSLLFNKDWRYLDAGILDRTHLRFFTFKSFERTVLENGFITEELKGINNLMSGRTLSRSIAKHVLYVPLVSLFGQDVKYSQFGFRIKN